jgi:polyisoprenoid-binding protein YceI
MKSGVAMLLVILTHFAYGQKYVVEKSKVVFFSDASIEDITAENKKSSGIFNAENGEIVFAIPIRSFRFAKSLMQQHFNEKYMESEKFPKSTFQGTVEGFDRNKESQTVRSSGKLTIHGVTKDVQIPGTVTRQGNKYQMKAKFMVKLADYNIAIPQLLWQNIAEEVEVSVDFVFKAQ